ncbi:MAG: fused MFS/spermidine synthase [Gemmatimonadetes bacterium]|nr:fused MFS/spermidine synthase [Gemmatimonadota bacterium]
MTASTRAGFSGIEDRRPFLPPLLLLFVGSGCAALVYQIVWFQMLQLVIGSTGVSLGVLLGAFMGGMFLGSLALPKYVPADRHPLRVYAALELAIGGFGLLLLVLIPLVGGAYVAVVPSGLPSILFRALLAGLLLIPPTLLMGATLPAISRYVTSTPAGVSWMGFFYGGNIAGAVAGCLLAGFYLLRQHDIVVATFVAVALNVVVAVLAYGLSRSAPHAAPVPSGGEGSAVFAPQHRAVLVAIGLSGLTALGSEVVWTRLMALLLGATTYTFSIILAVFLAALGIGSALGSYVARSSPNPRMAFALCQGGALLGIAWTAHAISQQLPFWPINPSIAQDARFVFQLDLARALWALVPAPLFWGASFPLAVAAIADERQDAGALMGSVYAANTAGAILGSLAFGIVVVPWVGTQNAQRLLVAVAGLASIVLVLPMLRERSASGGLRVGRLVGLAAGVVVAGLLIQGLTQIPPVLVAYGRYAPTYDPPKTLYMGEGRNSSIAVTELGNGVLNFHVGGKVVASTEPQDMRLQGMLGHLTALLHDDPKTVLIVGFGAGVTAGTFVAHPGIERIVICEIEPLITQVSSEYFTEANNAILSDPRVEVVHDDARHFLLTTNEKFDLITSDPIHPWMKGAAALYSAEYFDLAEEHLNDGGVITQWVPLYESTEEAVKSEMVTFFGAFPDGTVWGNTYEGAGYDVVLAARKGGLRVNVDTFVDRLSLPDHAAVARSLAQTGFPRALDLLTTYGANASDLQGWLADAVVNRDKNLRLMYLAGLGLNQYVAGDIYRNVLDYRRFPDEVFWGSPDRVAFLRNLMGF